MASRFPPVGIFDRVGDPADLEAVFHIEGLTNPRLRQQAGDLSVVPPEDRVSGPGTTPIMAAFTHLNPDGSRFTDGSYGVYYAARSIHTAIAETRFHRARFLAMTNEPPIEIDMRAYACDIDSELHDIRGGQDTWPAVYDPDPARYGAAQALSRELRAHGSNGIVYDSVREPGRQCVAVFRRPVLSPVIQGPHFCYVWDRRAITEVYEKPSYDPVGAGV
ncbi:MAG: RES family NAD+ phosphorylase [Gammaproteobacteria bacterium]|nr:RES family NAD+ phosphorylase [Gammaproteobacteria bacterium]